MSLLGGTGVALAGLGGNAPLVRAQSGTKQPLALTKLRDDLFQITGAGCNVVVLAASEGLAVVDSGSPAHARALSRFIAEQFPGARVEMLYNTHWHLDHTGGNESIARGAPIVAHENTRLWMSTEFYVEWQDRRYPRRAPSAHPTKTFFSSQRQPLELNLGPERIVYGHLFEAHTDGDIYVSFPERNVIVAGGAVVAGKYPTLDYVTGGWIGGLVDATEKLLGMADSSTIIVPESGPARQRGDLELQLEMVSTVRERIEAMALEGKGIDEMIAAGITKDFDASFGNNGDAFIENAYRGMWWNRLRGTVA